MAWTETIIAQAADSLIDVLDVDLIANANWSIYDSGISWRVYQCLDVVANCEFYVFIDDSQNNYATIELWQAWNAPGDSGTGLVVPTVASGDTYYIRKPAGMIATSVKDHRFIITNHVVYFAYYVGQLRRADETKNMPIITAHTAAADSVNPVGAYDSYLNVKWKVLTNDVGATNTVYPYTYASDRQYLRTSDGRYYLWETPVWDATSGRVLGTLEGACVSGQTPNSFAQLDVLWVGAQSWIALGGSSATKQWCAIERS